MTDDSGFRETFAAGSYRPPFLKRYRWWIGLGLLVPLGIVLASLLGALFSSNPGPTSLSLLVSASDELALQIDSPTLDFQVPNKGDTDTQTFTLTNTSSSPIRFRAVAVTSGNATGSPLDASLGGDLTTVSGVTALTTRLGSSDDPSVNLDCSVVSSDRAADGALLPGGHMTIKVVATNVGNPDTGHWQVRWLILPPL